MSSQINGQYVTINQMVSPTCVNTISNPSLPVTAGSIVYDKSTPNSLYFSNGTEFLELSGGSGGTGGDQTVLGTGVNVNTVVFTGPSGMSGITGGLSLEQLTIGQTIGNTTYMTLFNLRLYQTANVAQSGVWTSPAGTVPPEFVPIGAYKYAPYELYTSAGAGYTNTFFYIDSSGVIHINNTATSGTVTLDQLSCIYQ